MWTASAKSSGNVHDIFDTPHFLKYWMDCNGERLRLWNKISRRHTGFLFITNCWAYCGLAGICLVKCSRSVLAANHGKCRCRPLNLDLEALKPLETWYRRLMNGCWTLKGQVRKTFPSEMENFIVRKRDGFPSYQVCSLADDVFWCGFDSSKGEICGHQLWRSFIWQAHAYRILLNTTFHHHTLLMNAAGENFPNQKGDTSVKYWGEKGKTRKDTRHDIAS